MTMIVLFSIIQINYLLNKFIHTVWTSVYKLSLIKDIKFEGTTQSMLLGHYNKDYQGAKYFNTELNNVDMIGMNVVSLEYLNITE